MAVSRFFCQVCLKDFHFRSRYERHLLSGSHLRMREMLANPVQDEDTELTSNQQSTSDSGDRTCTGTLCTHMYRSTSEETDDKDMPYSDDSFQVTKLINSLLTCIYLLP